MNLSLPKVFEAPDSLLRWYACLLLELLCEEGVLRLAGGDKAKQRELLASYKHACVDSEALEEAAKTWPELKAAPYTAANGLYKHAYEEKKTRAKGDKISEWLLEVWATCGERSAWLLYEDKCPIPFEEVEGSEGGDEAEEGDP